MSRGLECPTAYGPPKLIVFRVDRRMVNRIPRMQVNRCLKRGSALPEHGVFIPVEILAVGLAVDHGSLKPKIIDRAFKLVGCLNRVLHRQVSKSAVARGSLLYFPSQKIVGRFRSF